MREEEVIECKENLLANSNGCGDLNSLAIMPASNATSDRTTVGQSDSKIDSIDKRNNEEDELLTNGDESSRPEAATTNSDEAAVVENGDLKPSVDPSILSQLVKTSQILNGFRNSLSTSNSTNGISDQGQDHQNHDHANMNGGYWPSNGSHHDSSCSDQAEEHPGWQDMFAPNTNGIKNDDVQEDHSCQMSNESNNNNNSEENEGGGGTSSLSIPPMLTALSLSSASTSTLTQTNSVIPHCQTSDNNSSSAASTPSDTSATSCDSFSNNDPRSGGGHCHQQQADYMGLALKQWSVYLGNVLLNFIHKECKNGINGKHCSALMDHNQHSHQTCDNSSSSCSISGGSVNAADSTTTTTFTNGASNDCCLSEETVSTSSRSGMSLNEQTFDSQQQQQQQQQESAVASADNSGQQPQLQQQLQQNTSLTAQAQGYCPCCHYHNQVLQQQQQQHQNQYMQQQQQQQNNHQSSAVAAAAATSHFMSQGYYNYAANFSPFFTNQRHYVQGKDPSVDFTQDIVEESEDERCFDEISDSVPAIDLPACELGRLEEISELVSSCLPSPIRREKLAVAIENEGYIKKLLNLFHMCEDLDNTEGLHHLYEIFKNIFLLNKNALFELMFAEDTIFDVVGCLEFDPSLPEPKKHRQYLKSIAAFHEVIKINNPELLAKIHQTYRVQYIQEVVLPTPSVFEENMLSTLSSFIFFNKNEIVTQLQEDEKFLTELFGQLTDEDTDEMRRKELVLFLKEFFAFSTTLQPQARESFFKTLSNLGVLQALEITLAADNRVTKSASIDILRYTVDFSPSMVREHMLQQLTNTEDNSLLMNVIIEQMTCDSDPEMGGAVQLMYIIRDLLDPENMLASVNKSEKSDFLNYFYKHCMHVLIGPLLTNTANDTPEKEDSCSVQLLSLILELLTFCVEHHTYHIKNYVQHKNLLRRILVLMKSRHTFLVLSALRFMRKIVALKDEFYNRYIIRENLFAPVIDALVKNSGRYNMMDSAICEMFDFIRNEDIKSLCTHVVEKFGQTVDKILYVQTFKQLRQKYEQHQDRQKDRSQAPLDNVGSILRQNRFRRDPRQLEEEEEMWFNEDDYDDEAGPASASTSAAVAAAAAASTSSPDMSPDKSSGIVPTPDTPLAAAAAVAAAAGAKVGFIKATTSVTSPTVGSAGLAGSCANQAVLSMAELAAGKLGDLGKAADMGPLGLAGKKLGLVDYDSDEDDLDDEPPAESQEAEAKPSEEEVEGQDNSSKPSLESEQQNNPAATTSESVPLAAEDGGVQADKLNEQPEPTALNNELSSTASPTKAEQKVGEPSQEAEAEAATTESEPAKVEAGRENNAEADEQQAQQQPADQSSVATVATSETEPVQGETTTSSEAAVVEKDKVETMDSNEAEAAEVTRPQDNADDRQNKETTGGDLTNAAEAEPEEATSSTTPEAVEAEQAESEAQPDHKRENDGEDSDLAPAAKRPRTSE